MQKSRKSPLNLGYIDHPCASVESINFSTEMVTLRLSNGKRIIKVRMGIHCVHTLASLTKDILSKYRDHIKTDWADFRSLNADTGANIPE